MTAGWIILIAVVIFTYIYNSLIQKRSNVDTAMVVINALLKERFDLIPDLTAAAAQYMEQECSALTAAAAQARGSVSTVAEISQMDAQMSEVLRNFMLQVKSCPELKDSEKILQLQSSLNEIEEQLAAARRAYNASVTIFNNVIEKVPGRFFAGMMRLVPREYFAVPEEKSPLRINE